MTNITILAEKVGNEIVINRYNIPVNMWFVTISYGIVSFTSCHFIAQNIQVQQAYPSVIVTCIFRIFMMYHKSIPVLKNPDTFICLFSACFCVQVQVQVLYWHIYIIKTQMTIDIAYKHTKCFGYNRDHMDNTLGLYIYTPMGQETMGGLWAPEFISEIMKYNRVQ